MSKRLGYLGPRGTFTEEAATLYDPHANFVPLPSISAVGSAVVSGMVEEGVVAIENSIEGSVTDTLDLLIHGSQLAISYEVVLPIRHCLLVLPGAQANDIKVVYSHPQALGQSRGFLERCFPKAQMEAALSTAAGVEEVKKSDGVSGRGCDEASSRYIRRRGIGFGHSGDDEQRDPVRGAGHRRSFSYWVGPYISLFLARRGQAGGLVRGFK